MDDGNPNDALSQLAECRAPFLIGVRHHSAALARVMPQLLDACAPQAILLEMPPDFEPWIEYLGRSDLEAPVALAACGDAHLLSFYPLADFSPELAAIRWAAAHNVPVIPCDLDLQGMRRTETLTLAPDGDEEPLLTNLLHRMGAKDTGDLWERLVETPASDSSAEAIRRAGLLFGWMIRHSSKGPLPSDAHREAAMRKAIRKAPKKSAAIVGSFHAAALLPEPILWSAPEPLESETAKGETPPTTSLVPYSFAQLDQRSGYPAGVMDPVWQQTMLSADNPAQASQLVANLAVDLCRELRGEGHVAGTPDATEVVRLARDLSRLRRQAAPGRGELLEAIETSLVQGDLLGRGRAVAAAAQHVLVGNRRGQLPKGAPRSGLAVQIEETIARLKLPGPESLDDERKEMRLDPLRSRLDRARAVVFRRLNLIGVHYAERFETEAAANREHLTEVWNVQWTHATTATVEAAGIHGVTLVQAAEAAIRRWRYPDADEQTDSQHPATILGRLSGAAECGLAQMAESYLARLQGPFLQTASAAELIEAASIIRRINAGHIAGLPRETEDAAAPDVAVFAAPQGLLNARPIVETALRGLPGLRGSNEAADVIAMVDLAAMIRAESIEYQPTGHDENSLGQLAASLVSQLKRIRREGSPRMQGGAWGALAMMDAASAVSLARALASWYDGASNNEGRKNLRARLNGLMTPLLPLIASEPEWLRGLENRFTSSPDDEFLSRLPSLRGGFQSLTEGERAQLLHDRLQTISPGSSTAAAMIDDPILQASATAADRAGRAAIAELLPDFTIRDPSSDSVDAKMIPITAPPGDISLADRWRLVLGVQGAETKQTRRIASTLDQLYGASCRPGRGRQEDLASGTGGGKGDPSPSAREWIKDVDGLFGKDICEEVAAEAAAGGRSAVLEHLNPATVNPSVELLEQVLSLRGALPERELRLLRKLARRITERLAEQLANRLRPALSGLSMARPTRRRSPRLDFARTLDANLETAYRRSDGSIGLAPRQMIYRSPARRQMDWRLIFVVDVSGSMEASVIYSALMSAVFSSLPAVEVKFFAFSTSVIEFSETVDDPLSLLMEVEVGGGTHIGLGLRAAREAIKNPSRTLVVLVSDFEEGVSVPEMLAEVRMLADSGAKLIGLAALDDEAKPRYHAGNAAAIAAAGMAVAAVSPERLAQWVGDQIRGGNA